MARKAQHGDVIKVNRTLYAHYGIYVEGGTVIHYNNEEGGNFSDLSGFVQETSLERFLDGEKSYYICEFNRKDYPKIYSPEETVARARSKLGKGGYNLITNNCEHFAVWCKTGRAKSSQVSNFNPLNFFNELFPF